MKFLKLSMVIQITAMTIFSFFSLADVEPMWRLSYSDIPKTPISTIKMWSGDRRLVNPYCLLNSSKENMPVQVALSQGAIYGNYCQLNNTFKIQGKHYVELITLYETKLIVGSSVVTKVHRASCIYKKNTPLKEIYPQNNCRRVKLKNKIVHFYWDADKQEWNEQVFS